MRGGLLQLPKDNRDFSFGKAFGTIDLKEIPNNFVVAEPLKIENQGGTDFCTGYASSSVSEDQEGVDLCPLYAFAKIMQVRGDWMVWGSDLRSACKAAVRFGFIKKDDSPFTLKEGRNFLANWNNWPKEMDKKAEVYRKKSYFRVNDSFDAFRSALWQNRGHRCSIITGTRWRSGWTEAKGGIIFDFPSRFQFAHALKIYGQKEIDGQLYLMAQLSNGEGIGDRGTFYFSREVINRDFTYGAYMFHDIDPDEAKKICWTRLRWIWERVKKAIKGHFEEIFK